MKQQRSTENEPHGGGHDEARRHGWAPLVLVIRGDRRRVVFFDPVVQSGRPIDGPQEADREPDVSAPER